MSAEPIRCSKCNGEMVQGFIFESEGHTLETWVEGAPKKSWWGGFKAPKDKCVPIGTFRCSKVPSADSWNPMRGQSSDPRT